MDLINKRVLVVDDMFTMRKIITRACRKMGFTDIIEADDGAKGWQELSSSRTEVGLVISDWDMPNCTGIDFLRRVRRSEKLKNVCFILLTAESEIEQVKEALGVGVDNFIVKPFSQDIFEEKIGQVDSRRKANNAG